MNKATDSLNTMYLRTENNEPVKKSTKRFAANMQLRQFALSQPCNAANVVHYSLMALEV